MEQHETEAALLPNIANQMRSLLSNLYLAASQVIPPEQREQELVIELDGESGPDDRFCWQTATISPISFQLDGIYGSGETSNEAVSITLKDGTSFALSSAENGYEDSPYGTYGSWGSSYAGSWESNEVKNTWLFSQIIDLDELASITVCGVTYPILQ